VSLPYDVFISYAHEDRELVARLRGWLEGAGFRVWLDEERMRLGEPVQEQIYQALLHSEQAVFVLSEDSLDSRWSRFELRTFSEEAKERRKIAVLRSPLTTGRIPLYLGEDLHIAWHDDGHQTSESDFSRLWRLCCGLRGKEPGKRETWDAEGRKVCGQGDAGPSLMPGTPAEAEWRSSQVARWSKGRAVWGCDRNDQWMTIETHAAKPEHEALFVVGPRGEGHNYFLDTIEECFPEKRERWIRKILWGAKIPGDRDEFFRALAQTLRCPSAESAALAGSLRLFLRDRDLVLVHRPVMPARLSDEALVLYYTRWLPELLPEPGTTRGVLKVIQGVDWPPAMVSKAAGEVRKALKEIRAEAHARLPICELPVLKRITRSDVKAWADSLPKTLVAEPAELVRAVLDGSVHSADILNSIVDRLSAAEETS
jgi:hypothetical protein